MRTVHWLSAAVTVALLAGSALDAHAGRVIRKRSHHQDSWTSNLTSGIKLGVYTPEAANEATGFFGGFEMSHASSRNAELVGTFDYFYRSRSHRDGVRTELDLPYDIPVEETIGGGRSYAHLGQAGVAFRLKAGGGTSTQPFMQVGANLQLLHLSADEAVGDDYTHGYISRSDTFVGIGWQLGVGLIQPIDQRVAFIGEAGYNHAEPKQWEEGHHTRTAKASGGYARLGLRFGR
jgi:opacity protein-like surface antigen